MALKNTIDYFKNFVKDKKVAAITPCSKFTVRRLCHKIDYSGDLVIVEYGPGSGGFTAYMLNQMTNNSKLITIEINEDFVNNLKEVESRDERLTIYQDSAENLPQIMENEGLSTIDYVISGIPFSLISENDKQQVLTHTYHYLKPGGKFLLYQTSYQMVKTLKRFFGEVNKDFEPRNIPPMYLMEAIKTT